MRRSLVLAAVGLSVVLAGCVGDTHPARDVRSHQAVLQAYGHTNNGPAYWWWEYGTTRKGVASGQGTRTPRQGPASSPSNVFVAQGVTGLDPLQAYYFRACGQDQKAGSPAVCANVETFTTAPGDSTYAVVNGIPTFTASAGNRHEIGVSSNSQNVQVSEGIRGNTTPLTGAVVLAGNGCGFSVTIGGFDYPTGASCPVGSYLQLNMSPYRDIVNTYSSTTPINASLGDGDDQFEGGPNSGEVVSGGKGDDYLIAGEGSSAIAGAGQLYGEIGNDLLYGGDSDDNLHGGPGNDTIRGGSGSDSLYGEDGNDTLYGGSGIDGFSCGPGDDTIHVDNVDEFNDHSSGCEHYVIDGG
jgi:Ca2+-binding RTX toxin-like protein